MADEGSDGDEWDADFMDQLVQAEELILSTRPSRYPPPPTSSSVSDAASQSPLPAFSASIPPRQLLPPKELRYSPPRELSQRTHETYRPGGISEHVSTPHVVDTAKERELELQKELDRVSKQLSHLEKDCSELRKERDKNLEQLKVLNLRIEANAQVNNTKNMEMDGVVRPLVPGMSATCANVKPSNIQMEPWKKSCDAGRDKATEVSTSTFQETRSRSNKLFDLWNSNDQKQGKVLAERLFKTCEADFHVLFNCMNSPENDSNTDSSNQQHSLQPTEFAKVLHLYSVITKISNDISQLEDLLEALVELSNLKNVFIVHWSLRVLHKILRNTSSMEKEFDKRENVTVEEPNSAKIEHDTNGCRNTEKDCLSLSNVAEMLKQGQIPSTLKFSNAKVPVLSGFSNHNFATSVSGVYLVSLFEHMCRIAIEKNDELVRCEALSIMNLILMRHNAYLERENFAGELVFQCLSKNLRNKAGFSVQDQAVHALYLLFNCPKVTAMISSCLNEDGELMCSKDMNANGFPTQELNAILIGLADCVACYGSGTAEEMKLRRNAISFLAFLGSSGKTGFEILLNHKLPKDTNFLPVILQSIVSDLDMQTSEPAKVSSTLTEQYLVVREALILLNRLVSHPQYAIPVLKALTETRARASTTVDVAYRLTQKSKLVWEDNTTKQIRESEILELARVFKKRVFTYLEDNFS